MVMQKSCAQPTISNTEAINNNTDSFAKFLTILKENIKADQQQKEKTATLLNTEIQTKEDITSDPFDEFLVNMLNAIKSNQQKEIQHESSDTEVTDEINETIETVVEEVLEEALEETSKSDPFSSFLTTLLCSLRKESPLKEESLLKEEQQLPPLQDNQPTNGEPAQTNKVNDYLKNLTATGSVYANKQKKKSKMRDTVKKLVAEQVALEINRFKEQIAQYSFTGGGGGGTNAVQYAAGGTMNGDLNVTGRILSAGVDISNLLTTGGGGGVSDRLVSGPHTLQLNTDGSITFPNNILESSSGFITTEGLSSLGPILSGSQNLTDIFLTTVDPLEIDGGLYFS